MHSERKNRACSVVEIVILSIYNSKVLLQKNRHLVLNADRLAQFYYHGDLL
jgi:hypothetical protein